MPTGDFTLAAWVNVDNFSSSPTIFMVSDGSGGNEISFLIFTDGAIRLFVNDTNVGDSSEVVSLSTWTHLAARRSNSKITYWINGEPAGGGGFNSATLNYGGCALLIGTDNDTSGCTDSLGNYMNGRMDDLRIYNRALSDGELKAIANGGRDATGSTITMGALVRCERQFN